MVVVVVFVPTSTDARFFLVHKLIVRNGRLGGRAGRRQLSDGHGEEQMYACGQGQQENRFAGPEVISLILVNTLIFIAYSYT